MLWLNSICLVFGYSGSLFLFVCLAVLPQVNPHRFYRRIEKNDKSKINEMVNT